MRKIAYRIYRNGISFSISILLLTGSVNAKNKEDAFLLVKSNNRIEKQSKSILFGVPDLYHANDSLAAMLFENAIKYGDSEFVELLLKAGFDPNRLSSFGESYLFLSLRNNLDEITDILLRNGIDPNYRNPIGESPLDYVIRKGNAKQANFLLQYGADITTRDKLGRTPLINAVLQNKYRHVKVLLKNGAQSTDTDKSGRSVFDYCKDETQNIKFQIQELFRQLKQRPFLMVRLHQNSLLANMLKKRPEEAYGVDSDGNTLYHYAVLFNNKTALDLLPDNKAAKLAVNDDGNSAMDMGDDVNNKSVELITEDVSLLNFEEATESLALVSKSTDVQLKETCPSVESIIGFFILQVVVNAIVLFNRQALDFELE